jgi:phosphoglycolate phosphatase-like HAD superfamily hydrolase
MSPTSIKLFLFDLDGTLVSTGGAGLRALDLTFEKMFGKKDMTASCDPQGKTDPAIFAEIIRAHLDRDMTPAEYSQICRAYLRYLSIEVRYSKDYRILPGVERFLDHLMTRGDILLGLGTGNLEAGARLKLQRSQLNPYFPFGGFGSDSELRFIALQHGHRRAEERCKQKIVPDNVYVIGDTELDVKAAERAGFRSVAVSRDGYDAERLRDAHPDFFLADMSDGFRFLKEIDQHRPWVFA